MSAWSLSVGGQVAVFLSGGRASTWLSAQLGACWFSGSAVKIGSHSADGLTAGGSGRERGQEPDVGAGPCFRSDSQPWPHLRIPWEPFLGRSPAICVFTQLPACLGFPSGAQNRCCRRGTGDTAGSSRDGSDCRGESPVELLCSGPHTGTCDAGGASPGCSPSAPGCSASSVPVISLTGLSL